MDRIKFSAKIIETEELKKQLTKLYLPDGDFELKLLKFSENLTYLLKRASGQRNYVLRLNRPEYHKQEELLGELLWMERLNRDTDLNLAGIIPGRNGKLIQRVVFQAKGSGCSCVMFEFLPGHNLRDLTGEELLHYMQEIGSITAILHNHAARWKESRMLKRFSWDFEDLAGKSSRWGDYSEMKLLNSYQKDSCKKALKVIKERLKKYGKDSSRYGLIHSDLNINNILVEGENIYILDFDDCGFGWFLYDLSTSVLEYFDGLLEQTVKAWLRGYEKYRILSREEADEIETFIVLRKIVRIGWIATHITNDTVKRVETDYYENTAALAQQYYRKYANSENMVKSGCQTKG